MALIYFHKYCETFQYIYTKKKFANSINESMYYL